MTKRSQEDDFAEHEKKMHKGLFQDTAKMLREQCSEDPSRFVFSNYLLKTASKQEAAKPKQMEADAWPECYGTMSKYPKNMKRKLIVEKLPNLGEKWLHIWNISEKQIAENLFEFVFCIPPAFAWPQGFAHRKGMIEKLVELWRLHLQKKHSNASTRLEAFQPSQFGSQPAFNWDLHGAYSFFPEDATDKTHILHKLSKQTVEIPTTMQVDNTWTIAKNWSDHTAVLVDPDGFTTRQISSFFDLADVGMAMEDWVLFAIPKAAALADEEDHRRYGEGADVVQGALAVVLGHKGAQAPGSASGRQAEGAAQPPR